jgi:AcrR family transcriptional regulator
MIMGIRQRRQDIAAIRRRDIMAGAWTLMESKGILAVTMDDIARQAEYTKQTLYSYFSSKDELLVAIHLHRFHKRWEEHRQLMDAQKSGIGKIRAFGESYYRYFTRHPADLQLMVYIDFRGLYFTELYQKLYLKERDFLDGTEAYMQQALRQAQEEGTLRRDLDLWWALAYIYLSLRATLNEAMMSKKTTSAKRKSVYYKCLDILLQGLAPSSDRRAIHPGRTTEEKR